jgi:1-acyl-sn-glycerol-3-phosphate acyltransferase
VFLPLLRLPALALSTLLGPYIWRGSRNVPRTGGLLVIVNHLSDADPVLAQQACPRPLHFMAESGLWSRRWLAPVLNLFRAFPVNRGEPDRAAIRRAIQLLKAGEAVCIFPEGRVSPDGTLQPLKPGLALLIRHADVPVIALRLRGSERIVPYPSTIPRPAFRLVEGRWGQPYRFPPTATAEDILAWAERELGGR